jgi:N-methylhydantoinase A
MNVRIAADIGGTFTDIALVQADGTLATWKLPSSPADYSQAATNGIFSLAALLHIDPGAIDKVLHACTVATNAILERSGARVALVTTEGFRDVLELRRVRVPRLYDPLYQKPEPLVPRERRFEVDERIGAKGDIVRPLDIAALDRVIAGISVAKVEAVAVCFLNSFANPVHERLAGERIRRSLPTCFVTLSVDVLPEIREYERTSSTVVNAYVGPPLEHYLGALLSRLKRGGVKADLMIMQSSGGLLGVRSVLAKPAMMVECGPAAGVVAAAHLGTRAGYKDVISFDMGGTTAKASLIEGGRVLTADEYEVGGAVSSGSKLVRDSGYILKFPAIDVAEVGAGGGSIAWLDAVGAIKVGPRSAGAVPGPACYGGGGSDPTVTDANVVLGFLNGESLGDGLVRIDRHLAAQAISRRIAEPLGRTVLEAAYGIHMIANTVMMRAVKSVTTYRGRDPRDFALFAFGGNGGVHGVELARSLAISRVVVPLAAGVFSAVGLLFAPVESVLSQGFLRRVADALMKDIADVFRDLEARVARQMTVPADDVVFQRFAALRFAGQAYELIVETPTCPLDADWLARLEALFVAEHDRVYGQSQGLRPGVEIVALRVAGRLAAAEVTQIASRSQKSGATSERDVFFGPALGLRKTQVIGRDGLAATAQGGPLIIEEFEGTIVIPPDCTARLDAHGNVIIDLRAHP